MLRRLPNIRAIEVRVVGKSWAVKQLGKRGGGSKVVVWTKKGGSNVYFYQCLEKGVNTAEHTHHHHKMCTPTPNPIPTTTPGFDVKHNDSQFLNSTNSNTLLFVVCVQIQIVLVQEKLNSNALSMELRLSYTNPSQCLARRQLLWRCVHSCTFRAQIVCPVNGGE